MANCLTEGGFVFFVIFFFKSCLLFDWNRVGFSACRLRFYVCHFGKKGYVNCSTDADQALKKLPHNLYEPFKF